MEPLVRAERLPGQSRVRGRHQVGVGALGARGREAQHGLAVGRQHRAQDFPGNSERYVIESEGYVATVVNGQVMTENGKHTGALSGHVLRINA